VVSVCDIFRASSGDCLLSCYAQSRKAAHTHASLASQSDWAWVPMSQTGPCVECGRLYIYIYIYQPGSRFKFPEADS
jgi:hypothetical protein